jgi:anti-sigma28 factor (negative regulator of flagellin synthesis)
MSNDYENYRDDVKRLDVTSKEVRREFDELNLEEKSAEVKLTIETDPIKSDKFKELDEAIEEGDYSKAQQIKRNIY